MKITLKNNHNHTFKHTLKDIFAPCVFNTCKLNIAVWFIGIVYKKSYSERRKTNYFSTLIINS